MVQEKKQKINFQDGRHGGYLVFPIETVLAILIDRSPLCFLPRFESFGLPVQKKRKIDGGHLGFPIRTIFFYQFLIYESPQRFLLRFESIGRSVQVKKQTIDFQDGGHAILDFNDFTYFWSTSHPDASYQVSNQLAFCFRRRWKIVSQDDRQSGHLGLQVGTILGILIYKSSLCFLPSLKSISLSIQKKKRKIDFRNGRHGGNLEFPIRKISAVFDL